MRGLIVSFVIIGTAVVPRAAVAQTPVVESAVAESSAHAEDTELSTLLNTGTARLFETAAVADPALVSQQGGTPRSVAFEYSDAYTLRRKIHVYASLATGPLFVTQYIIGDKLYGGDASGSLRSAHSAVAAGIGVLFAANTVTGVWNLVEARKDPNGRKRRWIHGLSMLGADVGFLATSMTAPDNDDGGQKSLHRNLAITSVSVATASYLYMLFTR